MNKDVSIIVPVHPPKFGYCRDFLASLDKFGLSKDVDVFLVFSKQEDFDEYGLCPSNKIIIRNDVAACIAAQGAVTIKKFFGIWNVNGKYKYHICMDSESIATKYVHLPTICEEFCTKKRFIASKSACGLLQFIMQTCSLHFDEKQRETLRGMTHNWMRYIWFNELPIYDDSILSRFYPVMRNILSPYWRRKIGYFDFEYILYAYHCLLHEGYTLTDVEPIGNTLLHIKDVGSLIEAAHILPINEQEALYREYQLAWANKWITEERASLSKNYWCRFNIDRQFAK